MRKNYEMTEDQFATLLESMKPVPMIMLQSGNPPSQQENANAAWERLGKEMGFDGATVRPNGKGDRFFSAEEVEIEKPALTLEKHFDNMQAMCLAYILPQSRVTKDEFIEQMIYALDGPEQRFVQHGTPIPNYSL